MTLPPSDDDDRFLAELRAALDGPGPVPPDFIAAARGSLTWRSVDADLILAELTFDSTFDRELATRSRSATATRTLAFDGAGVRVEVEVSGTGIVGQVTPADDARVSCQTADGTFDETTVDAVGCFVLRSPASGAIRLHVRSGSHQVATSWVCLT